MDKAQKVVIVGGGFAGVRTARALKESPVTILMIDANNFHTFRPLLYQVAFGAFDAKDVTYSALSIFAGQKNFMFVQGTVTRVDFSRKTLYLDNGCEVKYDYLVLAPGSCQGDFDIPGAREHAFFVQELQDALSLHNHILKQVERVAADSSLIRSGTLTFVIFGGGPLGIEAAGSLAHLILHVLPKYYQTVDFSLARIILLTNHNCALHPYGTRARKYTESRLHKWQVEIRYGVVLSEVGADYVRLGDDDIIATQTLIWATGVRGSFLIDTLNVELTPSRRIRVNTDLRLPNHPDVFVVGDAAAVGLMGDTGDVYPYQAQVAVQQGWQSGLNIARLLAKEETKPFKYANRGITAMIGPYTGVAEYSIHTFQLSLCGFVGWLYWLFVNMLFIAVFQNRVRTLSIWIANFIKKRGKHV